MRAWVASVALAVLAAACATMPLRVPEGPSRPLAAPEAVTIFAQASAVCRGVRTLTAEVGLSGRVGSRKLRGRVLAGLERSGSVRLEAPASFGAPVFIFAARASRSVLWFPRDNRVLRDAAVADVLEALTGLRRHVDDLLALLTGCLVSEPHAEATEATGAKSFESGWMAMPLSGGAEAFVRRERQQWRIVGGRGVSGGGDRATTSWTVAYDEFAAGFPGRVRLSQGATTDVTFRVSQLEANVAIDPAAFALTVPADAVPMSLDELRQMGPLADRRPGR
jgi:hypothetical protein